jgi:hypothetical protein
LCGGPRFGTIPGGDELAAARTIEYHRSQIRAHLGFRECSVADADKLTEWLAAHVCEAERRPELVRDELPG